MRFGHIFGINAHTEVNEGQKTLLDLGYSKNGLLIWFKFIHRRRYSCARLFGWLSQRSRHSVNLSVLFISHRGNQSCVFVNRGLKPWVSIQQTLPVLYRWLLYHLAVLDNLHGGREMPKDFTLKLKAPGTVVDISFWCPSPTNRMFPMHIAAFYSLSSSDEPVMPLRQKEIVCPCCVPQQAPELPISRWICVSIYSSRTTISAIAGGTDTGVI